MGADGTGGRLVGGSENGTLTVYNPDAIINSTGEAVVGQSDKHSGPVRALDFNPFQVNKYLLAISCHTDVPLSMFQVGILISFFLRVIFLHLEQMIQRYTSGI